MGLYSCCLSLGTKAYDKLNNLLTNVRLVNDIKKLSADAQTSCLEGFHSTLNHWHPKMVCFSWLGTFCRWGLYLIVKTKTGVPWVRVVGPLPCHVAMLIIASFADTLLVHHAIFPPQAMLTTPTIIIYYTCVCIIQVTEMLFLFGLYRNRHSCFVVTYASWFFLLGLYCRQAHK